jgi:biopolymer transport protein ExbD
MAVVKPKRHGPSMDMTPMVDLAFLLVTFFMLATKFAPEEMVKVDTPSSIAENKLPEKDILTISISKDNKVYFGIDNQLDRAKMLQSIGQKYKVQFTPQEINDFSLMANFGVPVGQIRNMLALESSERPKMALGVPVDSTQNELADWIVFSRLANPKMRIAIKGDNATNWPTMKKVISTLQESNINKFNLVTDSEAKPEL